MMRLILVLLFSISILPPLALANPYWDPEKVPKDSAYPRLYSNRYEIDNLKTVTHETAIDVLRIQIDWQESNEAYTVSQMVIEPSGTPALLQRSRKKPAMGSYLGILKDSKTNQAIYYDAIGTGKEYRKLARAINLRFPIPEQEMIFELFAENPKTGLMEKVVSQIISPHRLQKQASHFEDVEVKELLLATKTPALRVNIYAEGYLKEEKNSFWEHALKIVKVLQRENFPGFQYMSFYAVFHPSNQKLGRPQNLGFPVPERDSFLGLYYPYWDNFGRWTDIVYPTRENKFREGIASAPYDYPLVIVNHNGYWGVGNYMSLTAIPAVNNFYFTYLLLHEFGHFFGLNEEYEGGGRTELEFAPGISEPWSPNITFLMDTDYDKLKWKNYVESSMPLPTPKSRWRSTPPIYGAYKGGYADSVSITGQSYKPGLNCIMENKPQFCDICQQAIQSVVQESLGH